MAPWNRGKDDGANNTDHKEGQRTEEEQQEQQEGKQGETEDTKQQQNKTTPQVKKEMRLPCAGIILFRFNGYDLSLCVCVVAVVVGKRSSRSTRLAQAPKEVGDAQAQATSSSVGQNMARKRGAGGVGSKEHGAESAFWPCVAVWCGSVELQTKKKFKRPFDTTKK